MQQAKDNDNHRLLNSEQRRHHNSGTLHTEPAVKERPSTSVAAANTSAFGFNLSGFNKVMNSSSIERQNVSYHGHYDMNPLNKAGSSPTALPPARGGGQSFVDKRPSLQPDFGRHKAQRDKMDNVHHQDQSYAGAGAVGPSRGASGSHTANNSAAGNRIEFQQKRNSYSFNRKDQQRIKPKDGATATSTSP
jgi:hypothetical protein